MSAFPWINFDWMANRSFIGTVDTKQSHFFELSNIKKRKVKRKTNDHKNEKWRRSNRCGISWFTYLGWKTSLRYAETTDEVSKRIQFNIWKETVVEIEGIHRAPIQHVCETLLQMNITALSVDLPFRNSDDVVGRSKLRCSSLLTWTFMFSKC